MEQNFKYEKLDKNILVCTSKEHGFGTDAFLLANFSGSHKKELICDLGTGCGIIPMLLSKDELQKNIYGIDIQKQAIQQFELSITHSTLVTHLTPICADLKELPKELPFGQFDLVTCNPPYKANNTGILSEFSAEQIARHEVLCTIDDVCCAAKRLLRFGGRFCICQRPERLADVITAMKMNDIEPKVLQFVCKNSTKAPWLFLIEGKKSSKPFLKVLKNFYVYDGEEFTDEMKEIYINFVGHAF